MRRARLAASLVLACLLGACGGGLYIGVSLGGDDTPPSVSVASAQTSVSAGGTLNVVAAAADENGIDEVAFYRLDGNNEVRLGSDGVEPYEWAVTVPADGRSAVRVFARAFDRNGNRADSAVLSVAVTP